MDNKQLSFVVSKYGIIYADEKLLLRSDILEDIRDFFRESGDAFTIYVVEQRFVVNRGSDYFRSFKGKENYIDTDAMMKKRLYRILKGIHKRIPDSATLVKDCFNIVGPIGLLDIITSLSKIFTVQEHQAAGPDVIDPIIIQEGDIMPKYVNQLVSLHKHSILRPVIIILLKDNNFERALKLLSKCPHNTNIKMIRNSGDSELFKVINCGAENPNDFLDAFTHQCYSTCSHTKRNILFDKEWAENSLVKLYSPQIMCIRTNFLYQDKTLVRNELNFLIEDLDCKNYTSETEKKILRMFQCVLRLYRIFCNDGGKQDITEAYNLAMDLENNVLLAQVYRYAYFLEGYSFREKLDLLDLAYDIFVQNNMEDNAIYCKNNKLVRGFDTDSVNISDFIELQAEAINNVPGLVGMSHILNNVGVAHLTRGHPDEAIPYFEKGLDYAFRPERSIQKIALMCNRLIAKSYCFERIEENELKKIMNLIFDNQELLNIPFISSRYVMNIISIALKQKEDLGNELCEFYPIGDLIQRAFNDNILGAGQLLLQLELLSEKYKCIQNLDIHSKPTKYIETTGIKKNFLTKTSYNPFIFSTWF